MSDENFNDAGSANAVDDTVDANDINVADDMAGNRVEGGTARGVLDYITPVHRQRARRRGGRSRSGDETSASGSTSPNGTWAG